MKTALVALVSVFLAALASLAEAPPAKLRTVPMPLAGVKTVQEPCPEFESVEPKRYMIAWNDSPGIDGDYIVVIHPTQIFLRSMHNNPNSNYVYWVAPLSNEQYGMLVTYLDGYRGKLFQNHEKIRWWVWTGYTVFSLAKPRVGPWYSDYPEGKQKEWQLKTEDIANLNLRRILEELNRGLATPETKLPKEASIGRYPNIPEIEGFP